MMKRFYLLVQNLHEVEFIGEFNNIIEAEEYVYVREDHLTHGERWIVVNENFFGYLNCNPPV